VHNAVDLTDAPLDDELSIGIGLQHAACIAPAKLPSVAHDATLIFPWCFMWHPSQSTIRSESSS
jgi:hypothetical protein